jgi:hypothetical protein
MNRHGATAMRHWKRWLPAQFAAIGDPEAFFTQLGEEIQSRIDELTFDFAGDDPPGETYLGKLGRLNMAAFLAESQALRELALLPPESEADPDEDDSHVGQDDRDLVWEESQPETNDMAAAPRRPR